MGLLKNLFGNKKEASEASDSNFSAGRLMTFLIALFLIFSPFCLFSQNKESLIYKQRVINMNRKRMTNNRLQQYSINYIINELRNANMTIVKTDLNEPQIWFKDQKGEKQYVIIHTVCANILNSTDYKLDVSLMKKLASFKGYYAKVGLFSGDAIMLDEKGEQVPLSKRDDINHPTDIIYEDTKIYVMFEGFHPIVPRK